MDKRKLKIYFHTKTDFMDDFLPNGSLCLGAYHRTQNFDHFDHLHK